VLISADTAQEFYSRRIKGQKIGKGERRIRGKGGELGRDGELRKHRV
jgi:hypothetical protein